ncbi:Tenascin-X [Varanus komodoensis]|nr:Tenascin-X [Varanus komodoensis]
MATQRTTVKGKQPTLFHNSGILQCYHVIVKWNIGRGKWWGGSICKGSNHTSAKNPWRETRECGRNTEKRKWQKENLHTVSISPGHCFLQPHSASQGNVASPQMNQSFPVLPYQDLTGRTLHPSNHDLIITGVKEFQTTMKNTSPSISLFLSISLLAPVPASPEKAEVLAPQPNLGELSAFDVSSNSLRLSWTVSTGSFDSFLVQYKDAEGKPQTLPVEGGSRDVTISNLMPSHRYKFNLFGISGHKRLGPLSIDAVTAPLMEKPTAPLKLGELTASNVKPNSLDLSWTVETGNFDSFIIQYRDAQGKAQALPVNGDLRSLHLHDLAPSHRYQINLYGVSGRKRLGPISTEAETAPPPTVPPTPPSLGELSISEVTSDSVHLSWTVPTGSFDSFQIQYKDAEGKPQALPVEGGSREITIPNLAPSRRYKFNLYGVLGHKRLGPVSADTITASSLQKPLIPPSLGELSASDVTSSSVRLSWSVLTGSFDSFLIQYKDAEGKPQAIPVEGTFREIVVPSLVPSRRYKFNLYGLTGRKRLGPVSTDAVTGQLWGSVSGPLLTNSNSQSKVIKMVIKL